MIRRVRRLVIFAAVAAGAVVPSNSALLAAGVRVYLEAQGDGVGSTIDLSHPFLTGNPDALLAVSPADFNEPFGIQAYFSGIWRLSNNSSVPIPSDAHFWILAFDSDSGFRHTTTAENTSGHLTVLDHPRLNGTPNARPIVTRESTNGPLIPWPFCAWYDSTIGRWTIFYEDTTKVMPLNASFSVFVPDADEPSYIHVATADNINGNYTIFSPPGFDGTRPHRLFTTQRFIGVHNDEWTAVGWLFSFLIGNPGGTDMPENAAFNVFVAPIFEDGFELADSSLWSATVPP
jgi:hypothetical protein